MNLPLQFRIQCGNTLHRIQSKKILNWNNNPLGGGLRQQQVYSTATTATTATTSRNYSFKTTYPKRYLSTSTSTSSTTKAFNREIKIIQKSSTTHHIPNYSYIHEEIASRLVDRLDDILREEGFPLALDVGSHCGYLHKEICKDDGYPMGGIGGVRKLVMMDKSDKVLHYNDDGDDESSFMKMTKEEKERCSTYKLNHDEEEHPLPFPSGTFDLCLSSTSMHWVNDLPGLWKEINRILKPDGCFLFAMIGGITLNELNTCLNIAELEREGGFSTHVGPFVDVSDVGSLLSNAGFNLTTVDVDTITVGYPNAMVLMEHLQRMGENNVGLNKREHVSVDTFLAGGCIYDEMFPLKDDNDGGSVDETDETARSTSIEATVQIIYGIGWVPHQSQQKPKTRGSATHKVGDIVVDETKAPAS